MPSDCCYFVDKAAAAGAAPALYYFGSILHCSAVFTQNLGQTPIISPPDNGASLYHTWLTTSLNAVSHFRITFGTLKYGMRILLMSDGATCFCKGRNISRQAKELIRNGSPSELQSYLLNSNPSDDASCIILDCIDNHLMP